MAPELRSGLYYMNGLSWLAVSAIVLSIFASLFIIFHLKFSTTKWCLDYHFRLRFSLAVLLLLACVNQLIHFVFYMDLVAIIEQWPPSPSDVSTDQIQIMRDLAGLRLDVAYVLVFFTGYIVLFLILSLTLDRYKRIHGIRRGSPLHTFFILFSALLAITILFIYIIYLFSYFLKYFISPVDLFYIPYPFIKTLIDARGIIEAITFSSGLAAHYFFTIALLVSCIKSVEDRGYWWRYIFASSRNATGTCIKQQKRLQIIIRMIRYFLALFLSDLIVITVFIIAYTQSGRDERTFAFMSMFGESWIPMHVFCLFKLLDMFVKNLKDPEPKPDRPNKLKMWLFRIRGGMNNKAVDSAQRYHIKTDTTEFDASEIENKMANASASCSALVPDSNFEHGSTA